MRITKATTKNGITYITIKAEQTEEYTVINIVGRWNVESNKDGTALHFVVEDEK